MSVFEWKNVALFDFIKLSSIRLHDLNSEITAHCCNRVKTNGTSSTTLILCYENGYVQVFFESDKWSKPISFKCYDSHGPIKLCALTTNNILATVAQKDIGSLCIFIYDLNQLKKDGHTCISTTSLAATSMATFIQVAVVGPDKLFALGIGLENGNILLHFGNINRDQSLNIRRHEISFSSINGIQFGNCDPQSDLKDLEVFVISLDGVYCLVLNDKGSVELKMSLDNNKSMLNQCCTISQQMSSNSFLFVGRDEAIYSFSRDCRGPCYAIKGQKQLIVWINNHLIVVVKGNFGSLLVVVDIDNKLIVLHERISSSLCYISGNNLHHIITKKKKINNIYTFNIYEIQELNTNNKVRTLIAKSMYVNALRILEREGRAENENIAHVRLEHGNHFLLRGYFTSAVQEYAQTIGVIKPYCIISKLLNSRQNDNLMLYLKKILPTKYVTTQQKKMLESCLDRANLSLRMQQLWISKNNANHICDFKQATVRSVNMSSLTYSTMGLLQASDFDNIGEDEIFNFFLECGRELLSVHSTIILQIMKILVKNQKIKNILRFLTIFHDYAEFCANILSEFIKDNTTSDEKLHYHLLTFYLSLWRDNKVSSQYIYDYLKTIPLRFEKVLIISKANLFFIGTEILEKFEDSALNTEQDNNLIQCINFHINEDTKRNPLLIFGPRALLMILQKVCSCADIKLLDLKLVLAEKFKQNLNGNKSELQSIEHLNYEIGINNSLVSRYKLSGIEFRNRCCDICRQQLHMPSVYFLCQHAFHKDCLQYKYSNESGCVVCTKNLKYLLADSNEIELSSMSYDIISRISKVFASRIDRLRILPECTNMKNYKKNEWGINYKNSMGCTQNPFDETYDSNYNYC